jgi:hypothetical protein
MTYAKRGLGAMIFTEAVNSYGGPCKNVSYNVSNLLEWDLFTFVWVSHFNNVELKDAFRNGTNS